MHSAQIILVIVGALLVLLVIGNFAFSYVAERKHPPIGSFIECDGVRLHYFECGNRVAPSVVLFHGNGSLIQDFIISGLVARLARRNRVLCFDRPGFGYSQRPRSRVWTATAQAALFVKALNQLGVREPVVLGHSWGALVAIAIGLQENFPIRGLVLASGYYFPTPRWDFWLMSGPAIPVLGDVMRYTVAPVISWVILPSLFRKLFSPRPVPDDFRERFPTSLTLRPKQLRAAAEESAFLIPEASRLRPCYVSITCPVQIIHGTGDQVIEPEQAANLDRVLSRSDLQLVGDAGHMVTYADGSGIAQAVERLNGVQGEPERASLPRATSPEAMGPESPDQGNLLQLARHITRGWPSTSSRDAGDRTMRRRHWKPRDDSPKAREQRTCGWQWLHSGKGAAEP